MFEFSAKIIISVEAEDELQAETKARELVNELEALLGGDAVFVQKNGEAEICSMD